MDSKSKCIFIYGLPAVGKTTISYACCEVISKKCKCFYLSGDKVANISYSCQFTDEELNLKYENIESIIYNLIKYNRIIS